MLAALGDIIVVKPGCLAQRTGRLPSLDFGARCSENDTSRSFLVTVIAPFILEVKGAA